jgi:DNA-binding winged helix-turn-helix (wHTH) protein
VEQLVERPGRARAIFVIGPDGTTLNRGNLPPSDTKRWVRRRKGQVVAAVRGGLLSLEDACQRYSLTAEEFQAWQSQALRLAVGRTRPIVSGNTVADAKIAMLHKDGSVGARTQAAVRTPNGLAQSFITTGNLTVDLDAKTVDVCGSRLDLTRKEYEVMQLLAMHKGATLTKEMFMKRLYGRTNARTRKLIDVFICKLRKKVAVACNGEHYIGTVWGRGYMLCDPG